MVNVQGAYRKVGAFFYNVPLSDVGCSVFAYFRNIQQAAC